MMYCKKCGSQLADGVKFCKNCGEPVGVTMASSTRGESELGTFVEDAPSSARGYGSSGKQSQLGGRKSSGFGEKVKEGAKLSVKNLLYVALPTVLVFLGVGTYGLITDDEGGTGGDGSCEEVSFRPNQLPLVEENASPAIPPSASDVAQNAPSQPVVDDFGDLGDLEGIEGIEDITDEEANELMRGIEERDRQRRYLGTWRSEVGCVVAHAKVAGLSNDQIVNYINSNATASEFTELIMNTNDELAVKSRGKVSISGSYRILGNGNIEVTTASGGKGEFWACLTAQNMLYFMMDYVEDDGTPTSVCLRMRHL